MMMVAAGAVALDLQAAVHTEVGQLAVAAAQGAFTAGALVAPQCLQRTLVADLALALLLGSGLLRLLAQQVGVQPADQGPAAEEGEQGPHAVADVGPEAGQVGHQFEEEGEQAEQQEAPDEGPLVAAAEAAELPDRQGQQGAYEQQPDHEGPPFSPLAGPLPAGLGFGLQLIDLALGGVDPALQVAELPFEPLAFSAEPPLLVQLGVELTHPGDHLRVLARLLGGGAGRAPVVETGLVGGVGLPRLLLLPPHPLEAALEAVPRLGERFQLGEQRLQAGAIDELLLPRCLREQGEVGDQAGAHLDQEVGEQQGNQPLTDADQPLGAAGGTQHRGRRVQRTSRILLEVIIAVRESEASRLDSAITARPAAALRRRTPSHLTGERFAQLSKAVGRLPAHLIERAGPASLCGKVVREGRQPGA